VSGLGETLEFKTASFLVIKTGAGLTVVSSPPVAYVSYDLSFKLLTFDANSIIESVPTYNEIDSDVVLTTATPTRWMRPQPMFRCYEGGVLKGAC
jgi:hypothetical protein